MLKQLKNSECLLSLSRDLYTPEFALLYVLITKRKQKQKRYFATYFSY